MSSTEELKGLYYWTWSSDQKPPVGANAGVAFSGWTDVPTALQQSQKVLARIEGLKYLSLGGGNQNGSWSEEALKAIDQAVSANQFASYHGIAFDVEMGDPGLAENFTETFEKVKNANLKVLVTVSHSAPYGFKDGAALMRSFLGNRSIDILSPQLYTTGRETQNDYATSQGVDWREYGGFKGLMAPSIVTAGLYQDALTYFAKLGVQLKGFIQWSQT